MQVLPCIYVIANPKNSELFPLCKDGMNHGDQKSDRISVLFTISVLLEAIVFLGFG
ncbi:hypothetical protein PQG02_24550 [Nostoc sp. UHCC 0926]|uniref:hypothetical protein n=1 Tax=unclassified Nostoc TaxID=2593658 RepID=UPI002360C667|nr:hypothetical protein [Nostoc sp. UHCC 0926]WDD31825.1 hypothetical protein PQG02_24550 [Nostoc sp. UHCC 0926]